MKTCIRDAGTQLLFPTPLLPDRQKQQQQALAHAAIMALSQEQSQPPAAAAAVKAGGSHPASGTAGRSSREGHLKLATLLDYY